MSIYYGIDFGTTNCALVGLDSRTEILRNIGDDEDNRPMPSVVAVRTFDDHVIVGRKVQNDLELFHEDQRHLIFKSVKTVLDTDQVWETDTRAWNAEEISSELFRALGKRVTAANLAPLSEAVVAIPVGMTSEKRAVLRRAAQRCGINIVSFITEPTAAYIAHAGELARYRTIIVFDWGGGTLDISVLRHSNGRITEIRTAGLPKAGDQIDEILARWVHERVAETRNLEMPFDSVSASDRQRLMNQCEAAKIALQEDDVHEKQIYLSVYAGERLVRQTLTRQVFESLILSLVMEAIDLLFRCIHDARIPTDEIGKVLMVGGTTKLSLFQEQIRRRWDTPNLMFPDGAEWDIARGAAVLARRPGSYRTAERIGLELCDAKFYPAINEGVAIQAASKVINLGLIEDAQVASLLFAIQSGPGMPHERIGELHVPCYGFADEIIKVSCSITQDLVFEAKADSSHVRRNGFSEKFTFDELRWEYDLSV